MNSLRQRVNLNDLIRYLITVSRQNGLMRVREEWLNPIIFHQIEQIWPEGPSLLISHLVYAGHYYCSSGLKFIETIENEVQNASKLEGNRRNLVRCKWPFVLLDRLISERKQWIRKSLKMAYLPSRIHSLATETYPLEREVSHGKYQEDTSHSFMNDENSPKRLSSFAGKISPLVGLEFGLDSSVILDYDFSNQEAIEKLWKERYILFSQVLMGYVAQTISLVDIDQLTMWSKSIQMGSKEMAIGLNKITVSFVYKLLKLPNSIMRAKVIIFLIEVATYCYQAKDHTTSFLVASSLENNTIQRLKESWKLVPPRYLRQIKSLSRNLGINPYDNFIGYFKRIYPNEETSLTEKGLINMVAFLSRIERLKECRPLVDQPIILTKLRSSGNLLLPLYRWSADNQLKRYFQTQKLSDSDQKAIILFATPYANLTERMISDYMSIKEKHDTARHLKNPMIALSQNDGSIRTKTPRSSPSSNLIDLTLGNLNVSLGQTKEEVPTDDKPVIRSYPSFHTTPNSMSTIVLNLDLKRQAQAKIKEKSSGAIIKREDKPPEKIIKEEKSPEVIKKENKPLEEVKEEKPPEAIKKEDKPLGEIKEEDKPSGEIIKEEEKPSGEIVKEEDEPLEEITKGKEKFPEEDVTEMAGALFVTNVSPRTYQHDTLNNSKISPSTLSRPIPNISGPIDESSSLTITKQPPPTILPKISLIDILSLDLGSHSENIEAEISPRHEELPEIKEENYMETSPPIVVKNKRKSFLFRIFVPRRLSSKWPIIKRKK